MSYKLWVAQEGQRWEGVETQEGQAKGSRNLGRAWEKVPQQEGTKSDFDYFC